jgi:hypothetical protein
MPPRRAKNAGPIILALLLLALPALPYGKHLTDETVRDAYFLGQDADRCADFLKQYVQSLPVPQTGPQVSQIELQTPYAQIVAVSHQHITAYSAQQAALDYKSRGDTFLVRVQIMFTPTYTNRPPDFWQGASIALVQKDHIAPTNITGQTIYTNNADGTSWPIGANIYATFPTHGIADDSSVDIEVTPPEGPTTHATFDLSTLK